MVDNLLHRMDTRKHVRAVGADLPRVARSRIYLSERHQCCRDRPSLFGEQVERRTCISLCVECINGISYRTCTRREKLRTESMISSDIPRREMYSRISGGGGRADLPVPKIKISETETESAVREQRSATVLTWPGNHHLKHRKPLLTPPILAPLSPPTQLIHPDGIDVPQERPILHKDHAARNDESVREVEALVVELVYLNTGASTLVICVKEVGEAAACTEGGGGVKEARRGGCGVLRARENGLGKPER